MRLSKKIVLALAVTVVLAAAAFRYLTEAPDVEKPALQGQLETRQIEFDGLPRTFQYYLPPNLKSQASVVFVLHGARENSVKARTATVYAFDQLADEYGFIVVYPNAYAERWNGCREMPDAEPSLDDIDDVGFLTAALGAVSDEFGVDPRKVFFAGFSNGGQMVSRLAMESPDMIRAGAIISANLPTAGNNHCQVAGQPVAMMIVNGTDDPINPDEGGHVKRLGSWRSSGEVLSTVESAQFWARQAGYSGDPFIHHYPDIAVDDGTVAVRSVWSTDGHKEINLITVHGGGHTIPHPDASFPRLLGKTNRDISAPKEIWRFFQREMAD